jgi:hypothetical protein
MTLLRMKEVRSMSDKDREEKLKALQLELVKAGVAANRTTAKTKEIKRAISRLISFNKPPAKEELKKK